MFTLFFIVLFLSWKIGNYEFNLNLCNSLREGLNIFQSHLKLVEKIYHIRTVKRLNLLVFKLYRNFFYALLLFIPLTATKDGWEALSYTHGWFSLLSKIYGLIFATSSHFTRNFTHKDDAPKLKTIFYSTGCTYTIYTQPCCGLAYLGSARW